MYFLKTSLEFKKIKKEGHWSRTEEFGSTSGWSKKSNGIIDNIEGPFEARDRDLKTSSLWCLSPAVIRCLGAPNI